jgi:ABC-type transporter Mla subunit MlaD
MATDSRTTNRNYALPFPSNLLAEDVVRLRDALNAIDVDMANRPEAAAVTAEINQAVQDLIGGAPGALDTLNELAAALNDDANFAGTVTNELATLDTLVTTAQTTADAASTAAAAAQATADSKASLGLAIALG